MPQLLVRCIAPPIRDTDLTNWQVLIAGMSGEVKAACQTLLGVVSQARLGQQPELPSPGQRAAWGQLFEQLEEPARTPAFHMLWAANELALGRTPTWD